MTITHHQKLGDYHSRTEPPKPRFEPNIYGYPDRFMPTVIESAKAMNAKATSRHLIKDDDIAVSLLDLEGGI